MYHNVGGKIKTLAKIVFWLGTIACVIIGVAMIVQATQYRYTNEELLIGGIAIIIVGILSSWLSTLFTYAFGQLVEDNESMRYELRRIRELSERSQTGNGG